MNDRTDASRRLSLVRLLRSGRLTAQGRALVDALLAEPAQYVTAGAPDAPHDEDEDALAGAADDEAARSAAPQAEASPQGPPTVAQIEAAIRGVPGGLLRGYHAPGGGAVTWVGGPLVAGLGIDSADLRDAYALGRRMGVQDLDAVSALMDEGAADAGLVRFELRMDAPAGEARWFRMVAAFERIQGGRAPFTAVVLDVTDARRAGEALVRSDAAFRAMLRATRSSFAVIDPEDRLLWFNEVAVHFAGRMGWGEPALGVAVPTLFDEGFGVVYAALRARALAGHVAERRILLTTADGREVTFVLTMLPVRRPDGEMFGVGFAATDITRQARAEQAVVASDRILARLPLGVATVDERGVVQRWRAAAPRLFALPAEAAEGTPLDRLLVIEDRERIWPAMLAALAQGHELRAEVEIHRPDGTRIPVDMTLSPTAEPGGHAVVLFEDVTARRALQRQIVESQKMEAVGLFAAGLAHDFNNLLAAVVGHTAMMDIELPPAHPLRVEIAGIEAAAERATTLVRSMLGLARQRSGPARAVDAVRLVHRAMPLFTRLVGADCLISATAEAAALPVRIDPLQLEQVLVNLVVNARDACPDGGVIRIRLGEIALDEPAARALGMSAGAACCIEVADGGHGIAPEVLERIFEPFFTTKETHRGTGLGLSVCRQILRGSGGGIRVESAPGRGTRVRLFLPRSSEPVPVAEAEEAVEQIGRGEGHILLVEDVDELRAVWARLLERLGYRVTCASDGARAIELLDAGEAFDVLVSDVVMPDVGGLVVARCFRTLHATAPILLVSAYPGHSFEANRLAELGAELLAKPVSGPELVRRIQALFAGRRDPVSVA